MANEIRRYQQQTRRSGATGEIEQSAEQFSASGKAIAAVGGALSEVVAEMTKAQELQQKTAASNQASLMKDDIIARFQADPDPNNYDQYVAELTEVSNKASEGITLRNAKTSFDLEYSSMANEGLMKLNQAKRTKIVERGVMDINNKLKIQLQKYYDASSTSEEAVALTNMGVTIEEGAAAGFYTPKEAQEMYDKNLASVGKEKMYRRIDQAQTVEELQQLESEIDAGVFDQNGVIISGTDKVATKKTISARKKALESKAKDLAKEAQTKTELEANKMLKRGELTLTKLEEMSENMRPEFYKKTFEELTKPRTYTQGEKNAASEELMRAYFKLERQGTDDGKKGYASGNTKEDIMKFRDMLNDRANIISSEKYDMFVNLTEQDYQNAMEKKEDGGWWSAMRGAVENIFKSSTVKNKEQVASDFLKIASGSDKSVDSISRAYQQARKDAARSENPSLMLRENPTNYIHTPDGNITYAYDQQSEEKPDAKTDAEEVVVRRKEDGSMGYLKIKDFDPEKYEVVNAR